MVLPDYRAVNRANWDERAPAHAASPGYRVQRYVDDPAFIGEVVSFDRSRLGDVRGLRGVHLQCHIGTDTVSLARLGARMTGLDFSPASLEQARALVGRSGDDVDFVESDVYDAVDALGGEQFDLVFTGIGALCWLPSVARWAEVVAGLLRPGGRLFLREGHPVLWSLDYDRPDGLLTISYPYFERPEPIVLDEEGTYVETEVAFEHNLTHEWNHGLGQIITAVLDAGLVLTALEEHDTVPWEAMSGRMEQVPEAFGEWRLIDRPERLPHTYTLQAVKPG
jgi:SAM-dependent methyltransferase